MAADGLNSWWKCAAESWLISSDRSITGGSLCRLISDYGKLSGQAKSQQTSIRQLLGWELCLHFPQDLLLFLSPPTKRFQGGGYLFWRCLSVRSLPRLNPSVHPSRFSVWTLILVMDFQILLSFYRNLYLHMRVAHIRVGCTAPTGNRVMALCYIQIYIVELSVRTYILVMDFIIPCRRFQGGFCFGVVCPSFLFPSVRPAMDYGKLTKGALWSHFPPITDQVGKLSVACKDLRNALVMAPR